MTRSARNSLSLLLLIAATTKADGHHATAPHFYMDQEVVLNDAVITEFKFVNPHTYVYLEVMDRLGKTADWRCEMTSVTRLKQRGWTAVSRHPLTVNMQARAYLGEKNC